MGLIAAGIGAASGVLKDTWRDYIYCDALAPDVLMAKGKRRQKRDKGDDNIITNGSILDVEEGQCMIIVHQGEIIEFCAEPGEFLFDSEGEPSILYGKFGPCIKDTFAQIGKRFTFAGNAANDLRTYFFNTRELALTRFETTAPLDFRVVDTNIGVDTHVSLRCSGEYSYRISDPLRLYKNVAGSVSESFTCDRIEFQLKCELLGAMQVALDDISSLGIRFGALSVHYREIAAAMREHLSESWGLDRGLRLERVLFLSTEMLPEDKARIRRLEWDGVMRDPNMRAADAYRREVEADEAAKAKVAASRPQGSTPWNCPACGTLNKGRFCMECGNPRPEDWMCPVCYAFNAGKFCIECGTPRPEGWACPACGTSNKGRFCIECGSLRP